jgi:hypothetical protein
MDATDPTQLERDVETARSRLAADLMVLRSPQTLSEFGADLRQHALDAKDALVEKARSAAAATTQELIDGLKARVAANPAAALMIGAGIAWRLVRHPPIATALIGAGVYSLLRSRPLEPRRQTDAKYVAAGQQRLREQVTDLTAAAKDRALAAVGEVTERASDLASATGSVAQQWAGEAAARTRTLSSGLADMGASVKDRALVAVGEATERASDLASAAGATARQWAAEVEARSRELPSAMPDIGLPAAAQGAAELAAGYSLKAGAALWSAVEQGWNDDEVRDKILLGIAGIAIAAALGIASQRR